MDSYREIENLIYKYAELIDSGNLEGMAQLFCYADFIGPDGKLVTRGAEEFLALQRPIQNTSLPTLSLRLMNPQIRQPPDRILLCCNQLKTLRYNLSLRVVIRIVSSALMATGVSGDDNRYPI